MCSCLVHFIIAALVAFVVAAAGDGGAAAAPLVVATPSARAVSDQGDVVSTTFVDSPPRADDDKGFVVATPTARSNDGQDGAKAAVVATPSTRAAFGQVVYCGLFSQACPGGCYRARSEECMEVGLGYFSPNNDDERHKCLPGFFSNSTHAEACLECASGSMSSAFASEKCTPCPSGSFQGFAGKWWCVPCNQTTPEFRKWYCDDAPQGTVDERDSAQQIPPSSFPSLSAPSVAPRPTFSGHSRTSEAPTNGTDSNVEPLMYALIPALGIVILLLCACCRGQKNGQDDSTCDCDSQSHDDSQPNDNEWELQQHQDGQSDACTVESNTETSTHNNADEETGPVQLDNGKAEEENVLVDNGKADEENVLEDNEKADEEIVLVDNEKADGEASSDSDSWYSAFEE